MIRAQAAWRALCGLLIFSVTAATEAAHPLVTSDTGTQGTGRNQLEFAIEQARDREHGVHYRAWLYAVGLAHGWHDALDITASVPYYRVRIDDGAVSEESGIGDAAVGLKWRFYQSGAWSLALKPELLLPTGNENRGLGAGRLRYGTFLISSIDLAPWALHAQYGYLHNRNKLDEREDIHSVSVAVTHDVGRLRLVGDIGKKTAADRAIERDPAFLLAGAIYFLNKDVDLDIGYKTALTTDEVDGTWLAGLTVRF